MHNLVFKWKLNICKYTHFAICVYMFLQRVFFISTVKDQTSRCTNWKTEAEEGVWVNAYHITCYQGTRKSWPLKAVNCFRNSLQSLCLKMLQACLPCLLVPLLSVNSWALGANLNCSCNTNTTSSLHWTLLVWQTCWRKMPPKFKTSAITSSISLITMWHMA